MKDIGGIVQTPFQPVDDEVLVERTAMSLKRGVNLKRMQHMGSYRIDELQIAGHDDLLHLHDEQMPPYFSLLTQVVVDERHVEEF